MKRFIIISSIILTLTFILTGNYENDYLVEEDELIDWNSYSDWDLI